MAWSMHKAVWAVCMLAACAAVVVQGVPRAGAADCDRACCTAEVTTCCAACPAEPAAEPCHCQLDARHDQPVSAERHRSPERESPRQAAFSERASLEAPGTLGVSRECVAISLAVPIRPVRILYGVWRN